MRTIAKILTAISLAALAAAVPAAASAEVVVHHGAGHGGIVAHEVYRGGYYSAYPQTYAYGRDHYDHGYSSVYRDPYVRGGYYEQGPRGGYYGHGPAYGYGHDPFAHDSKIILVKPGVGVVVHDHTDHDGRDYTYSGRGW